MKSIEVLKKGIAKRSPYEFGLEKPGAYLGTGRNRSYWRK